MSDSSSAVLDAVLAGDRDLARDRMRAHLRSVFGDIEKIRHRSPDLFASADSVPVRRSVAVWEWVAGRMAQICAMVGWATEGRRR